ncbi:YfiR family protein [Candidatus Magnetobacterium casense]|uniref:YfiR family protein n=1 Tax=Candidatus Magnetobacterium casense TaxID=1455061 RepID=UPI0006969D0D|nr:YfiR family protein [Candidatus Magnetobacterium casensis]
MGFCSKYAVGLILLLVISTLVALPVPAAEREFDEYEVKAFAIYNLAKFIEWPDNSLGTVSTLTIYIIGDNPFKNFRDAMRDKSIHGKTIVVKIINSPADIKDTGILFISRSEKDRLPNILRGISRLPVLTVGDTQSFASRGVMVNFYLENDKIRFEINIEAAQTAGLKISSNLLKMGKIIAPSAE